jgi:hypothetical protein
LRHAAAALALPQRQRLLVVKTLQEIPRHTRRDNLMTQQPRQRPILPQAIQVLAPLAPSGPQRQQALHDLHLAGTPLALLDAHLLVDHRCRTADPKQLQPQRHPRKACRQAVLDSLVDLKR